MLYARQNCVVEWPYHSGKTYSDPGNEVELEVLFTGPDGTEQRVPAFWAGEHTWRVRFAPRQVGVYHYQGLCSDEGNPDLHGVQGTLEVAPYEGDNPLFRHGSLRVAVNRRYLEHADGRPFFWLADTWWMGLCRRLRWPEDFRTLLADRVAKGFTVIQIVAGLYPDMPWPDQRGANEAGYPWEADFGQLNPAYFDMADLRLTALVDAGLVPCIVGCWGYFLTWMGEERMKKHWRNLVARWAAYPVVWCLAGEGSMPWYLSETPEEDSAAQKQGWTEVARYLHEIDPYQHPITIHPSTSARDTVGDDSVLDFDMLQTGHGDRQSIPSTVQLITQAYRHEPPMPVINGEVCYEGILEANREETQRFMFWACMLSGACGHAYGANGIWQVNRAEEPFGPSPHGRSWGNRPWTEAYRLPGSRQVGLGKRLLGRYPWWQFEPHPEWVQPRWDEEDYAQGYAAGIPGQVRVLYLPCRWDPYTVKQLEPDTEYHASYFCPGDGSETDLGLIRGDEHGDWQAPQPPVLGDWVLVLERQ